MLDKMFLIMLELMGDKYISAKALSEKLDIPKRSVYRYIDHISTANIPVNSKAGKYGGVKIADEYLLPYAYFTKEETALLLNGIALAERSNPSVANSARTKLKTLAPSKNYGNSVGKVILTDTDAKLNAKIQLLEKAMEESRTAEISYHSRQLEVTKREIVPLNFLVNDNQWYIYCFCKLRQDYRTFKISRITHVNLLEVTEKMENYPEKWQFEFEAERIDAIIRVYGKSRYLVEEWLGIERVKDCGEYCVASANLPLTDETIYRLLSFGDGIKILSPAILIRKVNQAVSNIIRSEDCE